MFCITGHTGSNNPDSATHTHSVSLKFVLQTRPSQFSLPQLHLSQLPQTLKKEENNMEESLQLQIQRFEQLPSPTEFASQIESENVPAVFNGCIKDWKAFVKWNPATGGLDYLQERVGSSTVEAMLSKTAPVFYGDIRSHERVQLPFSTFIDFCKQNMRNTDSSGGSLLQSERHQDAVTDVDQDCLLSGDVPQQIYLAQVPIMNSEDRERVQLEGLREDIQTPTFLETKELASVNLWMNNAQSRSSTHYDPHHNVLCVVTGSKQVVLWPPSAIPFLYPMPVYGEASNHSSVALENPDLSLYPRAKCSMDYSQKVILQAGDALFIPEGCSKYEVGLMDVCSELRGTNANFYSRVSFMHPFTPSGEITIVSNRYRFHQVDSGDFTIAVNFWWKSNIMSNKLEHMDAYYLRRILRSSNYLDLVILFSLTCFIGLPNQCYEFKIDGQRNAFFISHTSAAQKTFAVEGQKCFYKLLVESLFTKEYPLMKFSKLSHPNQTLPKASPGTEKLKRQTCELLSNGADHGCCDSNPACKKQGLQEKGLKLHELEPFSLQALQELVSVVHDRVNITDQSQCIQSTPPNDSKVSVKHESDKTLTTKLFFLEDDPVAKILWTLDPSTLQNVLLAMAHNFPRTLEALILHLLSPVGAEVLTRKFDEVDQNTTEDDRNKFYQGFYGAFDDQFAAMDAILNGKELFAQQAFKNSLDKYLGVNIDVPKPSIR